MELFQCIMPKIYILLTIVSNIFIILKSLFTFRWNACIQYFVSKKVTISIDKYFVSWKEGMLSSMSTLKVYESELA